MFSVAPQTIKFADSLAESEYAISVLTLMKNAAFACYEQLKDIIKHDDKIVVLCGKGNNGGDGYELCRLLKEDWYDVIAVNIFGCEPNTEVAKTVYSQYIDIGGKTVSTQNAIDELHDADIIIDAVFGVGFSGSIADSSDLGKIITFCNTKSYCKRVAIDVPSGINSLDGRVEGIAFKADTTLSLAYYKTGSLSYPAKAYCGDIKLLSIGLPDRLNKRVDKDAVIPDMDYVYNILPKRTADSNKGTFGRLLMFCGSEFMTGAAVLSASGALRSGVGLVNIARNKETIKILQTHLTEPIFSPVDTSTEDGTQELMSLAEKSTAILIGCGLGKDEHDKNSVFSLIKNTTKPIILDADGINAVSENTMVLKEAKETAILTPHPLEFSRLTSLSVSQIQSDRINVARRFASEFNCVLVLKGASTVIAGPDGELAVCTAGGSGLSKGGSGDVLAGLCASLRAQGMSAFDSAVCAVYLHAKAGDILSEEISVHGFLPSDLPMAIAKLLP